MMIDILMATYNGEKHLEEQLISIENQTYKNWRLTVHDDGSSDGTWTILESFQQRQGMDKVRLVRNDPPTGASKRNFIGLVKSCDGEYMMCCDQDDVWHKDKVKQTFHRMRQMEQRFGKDVPFLVHTDLRVVDAELGEIHSSFHSYMNLRTDDILARELTQNQVTGCTTMINKPLKKYVDQTKNTDKIVMHDHWMALIALVFGKMSYLNRATIDYRQHGDNSVGAQDAKSIAYMWQRFLKGRTRFVQDMQDSCGQAAYFIELYGTCIKDEKVVELLINYAYLYEKCKINRIFAFFRYGFWKKGTVRKIMQVIWG